MSNKLFTTIPVPRFPRNTFSLSRSVMFNPRLQKLYCPNCVETLPGDGINERSEQFARTQPMVAPTFAKINADQHAFFVPFWQLNEHFDDFITGGEKGDYQDKMPWTKVSSIYTVVLWMLNYHTTYTTAAAFKGGLDNQAVTPTKYNYILQCVQSIIEHCDLLRSVPFVLPDFVEMDPSATTTDNSKVAYANLSSFSSLNSQFAYCDLRVNLCPFGAYLKVWSEYFRDENLCEDIFDSCWKNNSNGVSLYYATGLVTLSNLYPISSVTWTDEEEVVDFVTFFFNIFGVQNRAWKKDYFTAGLPFTQKGPDVLLPLSGIFPVNFSTDTASASEGVTAFSDANKAVDLRMGSLASDPPIKGSVDLSTAGLGSTIIDVRRAFRLEEFYEADGRGGNRYPENTLVQWGVRTPDSRLPRAIFLGSNSSPVQISEVVQHSSTDQTSPLGTLAGKGISYGNNRLSKYYYTMHGFLLNFYSLRVHAVYEQGIHPMFSRFDRTEYAWPRFANLGEQPVYTKELFVDASVSENEVFAYEPRYSDYKSEKSSVHHQFKGSLNFWTMSRRFGSKPVLNEEFIYNSPRLDNFAVTNPLVSPFLVEIDYRVRANRILPFFGVPSI